MTPITVENCQLYNNSNINGATTEPRFPKVALIPKATLLTGVGYTSTEYV